MKVQLNYWFEGSVIPVGGPQDTDSARESELLASASQYLPNPTDGVIWFYTTLDGTSTDIWANELNEAWNREFSTCAQCNRDIARVVGASGWSHLDGDASMGHPVVPKKPKKPVVILDSDLEKLLMKYLNHLRAMGSSTYLEFHHNYNSTVDFTDDEWAKLQELDIDAVIQD